MLDLIDRHKKFIQSFHVFLYEHEGVLLRFKAELNFIDGSKVFIKEYVFGNHVRNMPIIGQMRRKTLSVAGTMLNIGRIFRLFHIINIWVTRSMNQQKFLLVMC